MTSVLKIPLNNSANSSRAWQVCGLWIQLLLNQSQKCFWSCVRNF